MRSSLFLSCMALSAFVLCSPTLARADQPAVPEQPLEMKGSKKTVMFPHAPHSKIECVVCHHKVDGKENFQKCASSGCHDDLTGKKGEKSLYFVVHNKSEELRHDSCLRCHAKVVEDKPELKKALTACKGSKCHPDQGDEKKE